MLGNHGETGHGLGFLFPKIWRAMYVYLDESYNLQKSKGKMFISINGFCVTQDKKLRRQWRKMRKPFSHGAERIHANNPLFEAVRSKSLDLLAQHRATILSVTQTVPELTYVYFDKNGLLFDRVYTELVITILRHVAGTTLNKMSITIDSRRRKGGDFGEREFKTAIDNFFRLEFPKLKYTFEIKPSYRDIALELADFVSNTCYKNYQKSDCNYFFKPDLASLIEIKNPFRGL